MAIEFTADLELEHHERGELADTVRTPGFRHVEKIFEAEVQKFFVALLNIPSGGTDVLEGHRVAKTVAQLWEGAAARINAEASYYIETAKQSKTQEPLDLTEGMIDLGPAQTTQQAFEEGPDIEY